MRNRDGIIIIKSYIEKFCLLQTALIAVMLILAGCGGDEGDTIVKGSKDDQARQGLAVLEQSVQTNTDDIQSNSSSISSLETKITNSESDISALQTDVADNENDISSLSVTRPLTIYDSSDTAIGTLLQLSNDEIDKNGSVGIGVTPKGYLFNIDFWSTPQFFIAYDMYFESSDCSGTYLFVNPFMSSPMRNLGAVFYSSYQIDKELLYIPRKKAIRKNVLVSSYRKADETTCRSVSQFHDVMEAYPNDPNITGITDLGSPPHYLK